MWLVCVSYRHTDHTTPAARIFVNLSFGLAAGDLFPEYLRQKIVQ